MNYRKTFSLLTLIAWRALFVISLILFIVPNISEAQLFYPAVNYGAGNEPSSVAIGDLNIDGNLDLAVANQDSGNISVLLGNGDGTFQSAVYYEVGLGPISVAIGYLNEDDDLDLAVANRNSNNVSVLLGNGDGSFQSAAYYDDSESPESVAIGDLNGDANPDLAIANYGEDNVSVLLGNGDGSFQSTVYYDAGYASTSVAIGDLNGDTNADIVVTNYGYGPAEWIVAVLLGNGDGSFQSAVYYEVGLGPISVAIGDLNGDPNPDLAVANQDSGNVSVLLGNGDGTFQSAVSYDIDGLPQSVAIGDLNGDGKLDLSVANRGSWFSNVPGTVSVLFGNGDGSFQNAVNYDTGYWSSSVAIGDFNKDTNLDLAVANSESNNVSVLINTGDSIFIDIYPGHWAEDAIYKIYDAGITTGCSKIPLKYCPDRDVNRAQMAVFLERGINDGDYTPPPAEGIFEDVPKKHWAADWIEQLYKDGVTTGCTQSPLKYCPDRAVNRAQMAVFLLRSKYDSNYKPPKATGIFTDVPVTYWAADWIEQLYKEGITGGCSTNPLKYCPLKVVNRAQMAVFLSRTFGL